MTGHRSSGVRELVRHNKFHHAQGARVACQRIPANAGVQLIASSHAHQRSVSVNGHRPFRYLNRSLTMHLLIEELSRDRMRLAQREIEAIRMARRLRSARKQRRSTRIS